MGYARAGTLILEKILPWLIRGGKAAATGARAARGSGIFEGIVRGTASSSGRGPGGRLMGGIARKIAPTFKNPTAQAAALRWEGRTSKFLRGYNKAAPFITAGTITAGFTKGFAEETMGNQQAVDTLRFLGAGGGLPIGMGEPQAPFMPLSQQRMQPGYGGYEGSGYQKDPLGAQGQLALATFYTRHGRA
jgi:hypothetical protein